MSTGLAVEGLTVGYDGVEVVHGIDVRVAAGEVAVFIGANGAGKTTTLNAIAGLLPYSGRVLFEGVEPPASLHLRVARGLGFLPEQRGIVRTLTVKENLHLGKVPLARAAAISPELAAIAGRRAGDLSGGEQQILALTRVLCTEPRVLIADEISFGLAPIIVNRMLELVVGAARAGAAVLIVEQFARKALAIADHAYVMRRGDIVLEGAGRELLDRFDDVERSYLHAGTELTITHSGTETR